MNGNNAKVVLITGASSGIGEATALRLKAAGHVVYAAARRVERMAGLAEKGIHVLKMDVTDEASMAAGVQQILAEQGRIDALVNNAGYGSFGALEDTPLSEARYQFEVNVFGLARLTQLVLPAMRQQRWGRIVNVSSIAGKIYEPLGGWYHATKHALEGLSDSLRMEVEGFGIGVVIIEPGGIATEWGGIAAENLMKVSGNTAYRDQAQRGAKLLGMGEKQASPPEVIAKIIEKGITARRPKTRYHAGAASTTSLFLRWLLPDRCFDRMMRFVLRFAK
jgi:NAD(P)-dependent dehydrogenase (short-subunit alcohol dehydrogenase family)